MGGVFGPSNLDGQVSYLKFSKAFLRAESVCWVSGLWCWALGRRSPLGVNAAGGKFAGDFSEGGRGGKKRL